MFDCNIYSPKGTVWQQIPSLIHLNMLSSGMSWDITKHRLFGHLSFKALHWRRWCWCLYLEPNMHWLYICRMTWVLGYLCLWLSCINFVTSTLIFCNIQIHVAKVYPVSRISPYTQFHVSSASVINVTWLYISNHTITALSSVHVTLQAFLVKTAKNPMNDSYFPAENPASHCLGAHIGRFFCWGCQIGATESMGKPKNNQLLDWLFLSTCYNVMENWPRENNYMNQIRAYL